MTISGLRTVAVTLLQAIDLQDCLFWGGFACLWCGCRAAYPPAAPIVCGLLLISVSLYGATRKVQA